MRTVSLTLEFAQTVAIGAFNPYVITPRWLVRFGVYPEAAECSVSLVPLSSGAAFDFDLESTQVKWQVDNKRLSVAAKVSSVDCGGTVSQVLRLLPHTPVQAMGHNFHFIISKDEWGDRPTPRLGDKTLEDLKGAEQVRWVGAFRRDGARIEMTLAYESDGVAILFNHHRTINTEPSREHTTPEEQIGPAMIAAEKFRDDYKVSCDLLQTFFEMESSR